MGAIVVDHANPKPKPVQFQLQSIDGYWILGEISRGSFGVVFRAIDKMTGEFVAMKRQSFNKEAATEYRVLKSLPRHPRIIEFKRLIRDDARRFVYFVLEKADFDLRRYIAAKKEDQPFSQMEIKITIKKLLEGVVFLHQNGVMHRDLKPSNILLNYKGGENEMKICDFGLSAYVGGSDYSPRVGTRWYKAPELFIGSRTYSFGVDMWAVGCIMAEMVLGEVMFQGKTDYHQLVCIHDLITQTNRFRTKMATAPTRLTPLGLDFLQCLLEFEPEQRISAADALNHSWFNEFVSEIF